MENDERAALGGMLTIPPMPVPDDFRADDGFLSHVAYNAALKAWERVAALVVDAWKTQKLR